ncbi:hypothetical protein GN156_06865 [bacterium LRH843]|nr:hypothetical protein [bacterium LRH843]
MNGTYLLFGLFLAVFILILSFVDLLLLIMKRRLPEKRKFEKEWRARGVYHEKIIKKTRVEKGKYQTKDALMVVIVGLLIFLLGNFFFQNLFFALVFSSLALFYPRFQKRRLAQKRKGIFLNQFRDGMYSIASSLRAGASLQTALKRCEEDLRKEHITQKEKPMLEEMSQINHDIEFGMSVDQALRAFKERMELEDVDQFVDSILITRSKGGNLTKVTQNTSERIADKISIQQEIRVATAQKRSEAKLLTFFPLIIVLVLLAINPEYMKPMYENIFGNFMLFLAALMLVANYLVGKKVTDIDV